MWSIHQKLKTTASRLSNWSREVYGNIYNETKKLEKDIVDLEQVNLAGTNDTNRTNLKKVKCHGLRVFAKTPCGT